MGTQFIEAQQYSEFILKNLGDMLDPDYQWPHDHPKEPTWQQYQGYDELKPCPFCGSEAELRKHDTICCGHGDYRSFVGVTCTGCGAKKSHWETHNNFRDMFKPIEDWNKRTSNEN